MKTPLNHGRNLKPESFRYTRHLENVPCLMSYTFLALAREFFFYMVEHEPHVFFTYVFVGGSKGYV